MDCIIGSGKTDISTGYKRKSYKNKVYLAHRLAWILEKGEIPKGYDIHHKCGNKGCINTDHLEMLNRKDHLNAHGLSGWALIHSKKTHCKNGHKFDGKNGRQRTCSICSRAIKLKCFLKHKEEYMEKSKIRKRNKRQLDKLTER